MKRNGFVIDFLDFFFEKKNRHWEITEVGAGATGKSLWLRSASLVSITDLEVPVYTA